MKVKSLQIENLQSFFGKENVFEFTDGVNLISGLNSGGKSAIFNAFNWVLYNRLYITDKGWNEGIAVRDLCDRAKAEKVNTIDLSVKLIILAPNFTSPNKEEVEFTFYRKAIFEKEGLEIDRLYSYQEMSDLGYQSST